MVADDLDFLEFVGIIASPSLREGAQTALDGLHEDNGRVFSLGFKAASLVVYIILIHES